MVWRLSMTEPRTEYRERAIEMLVAKHEYEFDVAEWITDHPNGTIAAMVDLAALAMEARDEIRLAEAYLQNDGWPANGTTCTSLRDLVSRLESALREK
jgi:hypothetical protein